MMNLPLKLMGKDSWLGCKKPDADPCSKSGATEIWKYVLHLPGECPCH